MKRIIAVILTVMMLCAFLSGCKGEEKIREELASVVHYQYPIDITSEDWFDYSVAEKSEMLRIPQETLDGMSDLQLLYASVEYPYFVDVSMYGFDRASFETYGQHCTAFGELLSRKTFVKTLQTYGEAIAREYLSDTSDTMAVARGDFMLNLIEVYTGSRPDVSDLLEGFSAVPTASSYGRGGTACRDGEGNPTAPEPSHANASLV